MQAFQFYRISQLFKLIAVLSGLVLCPIALAGDLHPFKAGSLTEIMAARVGKPFILLFWSMDCASCMREMDDLSSVVSKNSDLDLVMVATDEISFAKDVEAMLEKHKLQQVEAWIFADPDAQLLRYKVDPSWFGELPRSYFYDAAHNRLPHSGILTIEHINAWRDAVKPKG